MNERIKELAELATETVEQETEIFIEDMNIPTEWQEKFAELIVHECADFVATALVGKIGQISAAVIATDLVEHFGVE